MDTGTQQKSTAPQPQRKRMALLLQRLGVLLITAASIALALSGRSAMELVEDAYAMSLVGMFVPFVIGIYAKQVSSRAAIASMLVASLAG